MPYKSAKQAAYLHINKPEVAKKFDAHVTANRRHTGSTMAKKLGSGANVARNKATHIKSTMKRYT